MTKDKISGGIYSPKSDCVYGSTGDRFLASTVVGYSLINMKDVVSSESYRVEEKEIDSLFVRV